MRIVITRDVKVVEFLVHKFCGTFRDGDIIINHQPDGPLERIPVVETVEAEDVRGLDVYGDVPYYLAAEAEITWAVEKGQLVPYKVERLVELNS